MSFIELHFHDDIGSNTRLTDTTNKVEACMDYAASIGLSGLAITDHESLSAHIKALNHIKEVREKYPDFRLILGNEIYLCNEAEPFVTTEGKTRYNIESHDFFHFILLAKDAIGHKQLRWLSSRAWERCYKYKNIERVPTFKPDVTKVIQDMGQGHLIASTACLGGEFPKLVLKGDVSGCQQFTDWCQKTFGKDNFFIELQPGITEEQKLFNARAIKYAKHFEIPWIITNDVHYMTKDKRVLHEVFLKSHEEEREAGDFYESTYFKTEAEMLERMNYLDEADVTQGFANTMKIGEMCKDAGDYDLFHTTIVPQRVIAGDPYVQDLLAEWYGECPSLAFLASSPYVQDRFFLQECEKGIINKHIKPSKEVAHRIDIEAKQLLAISDKLGCRLTSYYNLMQQIEDIIWQVSIIGPGRGSACCLYCAYLLDITQVDSLANDLPYWRHTHASKVSLPDIDIDLLPSKRPQIFDLMRQEFGDDHCLNIITFKTETLKSAIKTAARGLGLDNDKAQEMSNLVPVTRGRVWTFKEIVSGNADNGFQPVTELLNLIDSYPGLHEAIAEIEGLVNGRGMHASGFYVLPEAYVEHNSLMQTPAGVRCTCWEMADSDATGALKFDLLVTDAVEKIQKTMELLLKDGLIQWQGSLKATYNKYLHPDVLNYTDKQMWDHVGHGDIVDLFQFMSDVGIQAVNKIQPRSLKELAVASSIMRLMSEGGETPIDRYVRMKRNINEWYQEMKDAGLNEQEMNVLRSHLERNAGCSVEQEDVMELSMDPAISGFDMSQADTLRKVIGKKLVAKLPSIRQMYYEEGTKHGTRKAMLDYVWMYGFAPQLGYAFARPHVLAYAIVALQEMNLYAFYPHVYWQTACLTVNASANEDDIAGKTTNYGKIATAISNMQKQHVFVDLPDINEADFGFKPDAEHNSIIFGLKAINGVGDEAAEAIIRNRPYRSLEDIMAKVPDLPTKTYVNLVKAGAFHKFLPRTGAMQHLVAYLANRDCPPKVSLNMQNFKAILAAEILPPRFDFEKRLFNFRPLLKANKYALAPFGDAGQIFFNSELAKRMTEDEQYAYDENGDVIFLPKPFEKWYKKQMEPVVEWVKSPETLAKFNAAASQAMQDELVTKHFQGTVPHWEMESLSFYHTSHEMAPVSSSTYAIDNFFNLPTSPVEVPSEGNYKQFVLNRIAGTVLDKNKMRHTISLLTQDGVVNVKFYSGAFSHYDKQISVNEGDKKTVLEKSWFSRGTMLLITGIRREDSFFPKVYRGSIYQHTVQRILQVFPSGRLELQSERVTPNGAIIDDSDD